MFKNRRMVEIESFLEQIAPSEANVLVLGESGVGKEVVANLVHVKSRRAKGPLVKLNCAALPSQMIEGELFGYLKGAFTGAVSDFPGLIAAAEGGTLFLDEIGEMPAALQTRFLRVLQEREYRPLGSTRTMPADFRLVAATNQPIGQALREGRLRSDLYYRLNTFQIEVPPLRERREDVAPLAAHFLARFAREEGRPAAPRVSAEAMACGITLGSGTCGNSRTPCSTPSSWPRTSSSRRPTCRARCCCPRRNRRISRCRRPYRTARPITRSETTTSGLRHTIFPRRPRPPDTRRRRA